MNSETAFPTADVTGARDGHPSRPLTLPRVQELSDAELVVKLEQDAEAAWPLSTAYKKTTEVFNMLEELLAAKAEASEGVSTASRARSEARKVASEVKDTALKESEVALKESGGASKEGEGKAGEGKGHGETEGVTPEWLNKYVEPVSWASLTGKQDVKNSFIADFVQRGLIEVKLRQSEQDCQAWKQLYEAEVRREKAVHQERAVPPSLSNQCARTPLSSSEANLSNVAASVPGDQERINSVNDVHLANQPGTPAAMDSPSIVLPVSNASTDLDPFVVSGVDANLAARTGHFVLGAPPTPPPSSGSVASPARRRRWVSAEARLMESNRFVEASGLAGAHVPALRSSPAVRQGQGFDLRRVALLRSLQTQSSVTSVQGGTNDSANAAGPAVTTPVSRFARERHPRFATPL